MGSKLQKPAARLRAIPALLSAAALMVLSAEAFAAPVTYVFSGNGSGSVGATPFSNSDYVITLRGDTSGIVDDSPTVSRLATSATMEVDGIGLATITEPDVGMFTNHDTDTIGFWKLGDTDYLDVSHPSFSTYTLDQSLVLSGLTATALFQFHDVASDLGAVALSSSGPVTFEAYVFAGSYKVHDGPDWETEPVTYSCVEACALLFGGDTLDYACSTSDAGVDHSAWASGYADDTHCFGGTPIGETVKQCATYTGYGCFSAYIHDNCYPPGGYSDVGASASVNYCFDLASCGNATVDAGEECDDGNMDNGDSCDSNCADIAPAVCANGSVEAGEQCDDGNTVAGDCCSSTCQFESGGSVCDNGDVCTGDACDGAGSCVAGTGAQNCDDGNACTRDTCSGACLNGAYIDPFCATGTKSLLKVKAGAPGLLKWKLVGGPDLEQGHFGDPVTTTPYTLCVFDTSDAVSTSVSAKLDFGVSDFWTSKDPKGFLFKDPTGSRDGVLKALVKTGVAGKSKALVISNASQLPPAAAMGLTYFEKNPRVAVQLHAGNTCLGSEYSTALRNTEAKFLGKTP